LDSDTKGKFKVTSKVSPVTEDLPGQLALPIPEMPNAQVLRGYVGLITPEELSKALNIAVQTLAGWRSAGTGPAYTKLGKSVFYRLADVQEWIKANIVEAVVGGKAA